MILWLNSWNRQIAKLQISSLFVRCIPFHWDYCRPWLYLFFVNVVANISNEAGSFSMLSLALGWGQYKTDHSLTRSWEEVHQSKSYQTCSEPPCSNTVRCGEKVISCRFVCDLRCLQQLTGDRAPQENRKRSVPLPLSLCILSVIFLPTILFHYFAFHSVPRLWLILQTGNTSTCHYLFCSIWSFLFSWLWVLAEERLEM